MKKIPLLIIYTLFHINCFGQTYIEQNVGGWSGKLANSNNFSFEIYIEKDDSGSLTAEIKGTLSEIKEQLLYDSVNHVYEKDIQDFLTLTVKLSHSSNKPIVFVQNGHHLSNVEVDQISSNRWRGKWNLFMTTKFDPTFYLSVESPGNQEYAAYGFFRTPLSHYMNCRNFSYSDKNIEFKDLNSGIRFEGKLVNPDSIHLNLRFLDDYIDVGLNRLDHSEWQIGVAEPTHISYTGKIVDSPQKDLVITSPKKAGLSERILHQLIEDVKQEKLLNTNSILIAKNNKIAFEEYFYGFDHDIPHDTRSASKSVASAAIGIAIDQGFITDVDDPIVGYLEEYKSEIKWDARKDSITIHHLLTMSSGLDAIDGGTGKKSYASEWVYQKKNDWTMHILNAPMVYKSGSGSYYGGGNPHLLAPILKKATHQPIEFYLYQNLFQPLGWSNYRIQTNNKNLPYFGGGWYLTPRDLLRFGLLFLNHGKWNGRQIMSSDWIDKSLSKHNILKNRNNIEYGYLWWHNDYKKGEKSVSSIEARGNGGQYIFIVPEYEMVAVITSGNFRKRELLRQPENILENYILKAIEE